MGLGWLGARITVLWDDSNEEISLMNQLTTEVDI